MFNQNVLWNLEDLGMLFGTDLPIFGSGTYPCLSLKLRSMSKPIRVLSGIDYWLDNLMCYVPEVAMSYHLNGFVQKYELVMTENLPSLNDSTYSPKVIRHVAQNILSFLKSNTIKAGHTYWLFKGKNDDAVKLYDLSSLCSESLVEECCEGQHSFTVPVAMLLYRVAQNIKYNCDEPLSTPATIKILLNNCLKLLNKTKYPQILTSIYYMLSDLYIPFNTNPTSPKLEDFINMDDNSFVSHVNSNENLSSSSDVEEPIFSIETHHLCLSHKKKKLQKPKFPPSETIVMTLEERCRKALFNVGCGLGCLHYLKDINQQFTNKENVKLIEDEPISASSSAITPYKVTEIGRKMKRDENFVNKGFKNKNRKHMKGNVVVENDDESKNILNTLLCKSVAEIMPTWYNPPNAHESFLWKQRLNILLYEKACLAYAILAENDFTCKKYGRSLKYYRSVFKCWLCIINTHFNDLIGFLLERSADCCLLIAQNWDKAQLYTIELETDDDCDLKIRESLLGKFDDCKQEDFNLIPSNFESKDGMLNAAAKCYKRSLEFETNENNKNHLNRRIGHVYCEITSVYIDEIATALKNKTKLSSSRLQWLLQTSKHCLSIGIDKFESTYDLINLASLYSNMGRLYRYISCYSSQNQIYYSELVTIMDFTKKAVESYTKGLVVLGNRRFNLHLWDMIFWDLSTTTYNMAIKYQDNPPVYSDQTEAEKEVISLLLKALKYCDLENDVSRKLVYEFRAADIHDRLGSLHHFRLKFMKGDMPKFKITLHQCTSHYNKSFEMFFKIERPIECLEVLIKTIALDELQIESATHSQSKVKFIISITQKLTENCVSVLQMLLESKLDDCKNNQSTDIESIDKADQNSEDGQEREKKKLNLLKLLEDRLQHILMCMIKLSIAKLPKLVNKTDQLKKIYEELLRTSEAGDNYSHLLRVVTQIKELSL